MKFHLKYYDNIRNKPSFKFSINLFQLKQSGYFSIKHINFLRLFLCVQRIFKVKPLKSNYTFFVTVVI